MARLRDAVLATVIFLGGAWIGGTYRQAFYESGAPPEVAQREFGAAVSLACGRGFVDPGTNLPEDVERFLEMKRDRISCDALPPQTQQTANVTQGLYRYLMSAVALVWMMTGVSWSALGPLFGVAYGLTLVAAYGVFRIGMGRLWAFLAACALAISAIHLGQLPYLRDYAKAPFILGLILVIARMAVPPVSPRRVLTLSVAFGAILGVGFGFRNDVLVTIVPWVLVVTFGLPGRLHANLPLKAAALAASAVTFAVAAWPVLSAYSRGSNTGHVALLGLMTPFNASLGVNGSIYEWGYLYLDGYAATLINSYTLRVHGQPVDYLSPAYDRAMVEYLVAIARHWPADMMARAYAATLRVLEMPFTVGAYTNGVPYGLNHPAVVRFYEWQMQLLRALNGAGVLVVAAAIVTVSLRSVRAAVLALLGVLYLSAYPALQFQARHFFHLEFIAWGAIAYFADRTVRGVAPRALAPFRVPAWSEVRRQSTRAAAFAAGAVLAIAGPLFALRMYQDAHIRTLLRSAYLDLEREPVDVVPASAGERCVIVETPNLWVRHATGPRIRTEYLVAEFSPSACTAAKVPATFRYAAADTSVDFTRSVPVRLTPGGTSTLVFFPAFENTGWSRFQGVELLKEHAACLTAVSRLRPVRLPEVLLGVQFTPDWASLPLHQTLARFEQAPADAWPAPSDGVAQCSQRAQRSPTLDSHVF